MSEPSVPPEPRVPCSSDPQNSNEMVTVRVTRPVRPPQGPGRLHHPGSSRTGQVPTCDLAANLKGGPLVSLLPRFTEVPVSPTLLLKADPLDFLFWTESPNRPSELGAVAHACHPSISREAEAGASP